MTDHFDVFDYSAWPLVDVRLLRAPADDDEISTFQSRFKAMLQIARDGDDSIEPGRLFIMLNVDGIAKATPSQLYRARSFIGDVQTMAEAAIEAVALVATNSLVNTVLMLLLAVKPLMSVHQIFTSNEDALQWLHAYRHEQTPVT